MMCPINQSDWRTVKAWAEGELALCARALESHTPEIQTAAFRGRVAQLRRLLDWGEPSTTEIMPTHFDVSH
jgi:hypothetical protein